jgi:protein-S-isoprenylcysteine O-methyltransferase Ste14
MIERSDLIEQVTIWSPLNSGISAAAVIPVAIGDVVATFAGEHLRTFFTDRLDAIRRTKLYDLFAAMPFIAWLLFWAAQMLPSLVEQIQLASFFFFHIHPSALPLSVVLTIVSKVCTLVFLSTLVVMFTVRRVPTGRAGGLYPRFAALAGTFSTIGIVWLPPQDLSPTLYLISLLLMIGGTTFALSAVFVLGRSISLMPEVRKLITWGPYALVRHPLYVGEMIATAGLAMQFLMPWALVLLALSCILQFERVRNEERLLVQAFPRYRDYMANTARFLPGVC